LAVTILCGCSDAEALRAKQKVCSDQPFHETTSVWFMIQKKEEEKSAAAAAGATEGTAAAGKRKN
jgi:hypothetical protein